jgi:dTDP-4-dehydrorhamnose reductase
VAGFPEASSAVTVSGSAEPEVVEANRDWLFPHFVDETGKMHLSFHALVLRTSWVYAGRGRNFLLTMLRLGAERPELRVVDDQHGAPTWARDIACATVRLLAAPPTGLFHLTAAGETTWHGFATEIFRQAALTPVVNAISAAEYPTAARRPANSVLDTAKLRQTTGIAIAAWDERVTACLSEVLAAGKAPAAG